MNIKRLSHSLSAILVASLVFSGLSVGSYQAASQSIAPGEAESGGNGGGVEYNRGMSGKVVVSDPVLPADTSGLPPALVTRSRSMRRIATSASQRCSRTILLPVATVGQSTA